MKTMALLLMVWCFLAAPAWAAGTAQIEGFDLGQSIDQAAKLAEQKNLRMYYDEKEGERLNRAYAGRLMGLDNIDLSLVFRGDRLAMISLTLEQDSAEGRKIIAKKYKELEAEYRKLGAEQAEAVMPGLTDWVLPDRLISIYKPEGDGKLVISITSRN